MGMVSAFNILLILAYYLAGPINLRNIYHNIIKKDPHKYITNPSYSWLVIGVLFLSEGTFVLSLLEQIRYISNPLLIVAGFLGVLFAMILALTILLVFSIPFETINYMVEEIKTSKLLMQDLSRIINKYNELVTATKKFLFCSYSSQVGLFIVNLYNMVMFSTGCFPLDQVLFHNKP